MKQLLTIITLSNLLLPTFLVGDAIRHAGVLGNSGEQGNSLVRFAEKTASGMGVVYDSTGSLWDRAGDGKLNRYALDGRLIASYPIAKGGAMNDRDTIVLVGKTILLKVGKKLYSLPVDAPSGTEPDALPVDATRLSLSSHEGWAAAANEKNVFLINAKGETRDVGVLDEEVADIEIGPEGGIFAHAGGKWMRIDPTTRENERGPFTLPGDRPQWLAGNWYGHSYHGTIRRFDSQFSPSPGVTLGGASGSFIGYVPCNYHLENGRGMAHLGKDLFAVSGMNGGIQLLEWGEAEQRFEIIRSINSIVTCGALALDDEGRIWFEGGVWQWNDNPAAPIQHGAPHPDSSAMFGASILNGKILVAPATFSNHPVIYSGPLNDRARRDGQHLQPFPDNTIASTVVNSKNKDLLIVVDEKGKGSTYLIGNDGRISGKAGDLLLETKSPLQALTSLASPSPEVLLAAADGSIIEFAPEGETWKEERRWQNWGAGAEHSFGTKIHVAASEGLVWVSDTNRNRVLCFQRSDHSLIGVFGTMDQAGTDLTGLDQPKTLAANKRRAVIFDSANQRLVRLELNSQ